MITVTIQVVVAVVTMTCTAYTSCDPGMRCDGITASGVEAYPGVVAAGPELSFGTELYITGREGKHVVADRGSAIGRGRLDIWMETRREALEWGVRRCRVLILGKKRIRKRARGLVP